MQTDYRVGREMWSRKSRGTHLSQDTLTNSAVDGEEKSQVANDAAVTLKVMKSHYLATEDRQLRFSSNRMYRRLLSDLPTKVLEAFGYSPPEITDEEEITQQLDEARSRGDWNEVIRLASLLKHSVQRNRFEDF